MPKKVTFDVTANTRGAQKDLGAFGGALTAIEGGLRKLGPVGNGVADILAKIGPKGVTAAAGIGIATAAVGFAVAEGEKAIDTYVQLGETIRKYSLLTGQSAEVSSAQVEAFQALGVESEVAAAGVFKLAKAVELTPDKLAAAGIEIKRNVDGSVDLNETLLNVARAYQSTGDAGKRAAIIFAAFGKAGAAMIPILETNTAKLRELEKTAASIYTQKDLDAIRQEQIEQKRLDQNVTALGVSYGRILLPAKAKAIDMANEEIYLHQKLAGSYADLAVETTSGGLVHTAYAQKLLDEYRAAQAAGNELDNLAQSQKDAAQTAIDAANAEDTLYNAINKNRDAHFAYRQALIDVKKAQADATKSKGKDVEANLRLEEAIANVGDTAVAAANAQRTADGEAALTTDESVAIQIGALQKLEKGLAPNSPLRKNIDAYIAQLRGIPTAVNTTISASTAGYGGSSSVKRKLASGGSLAPGETAIVGEAGAELVTGGANGASVTPMSKGGGHVTVNINGGMFMDHGPTIDAFVKAILRHARFRPGT